MRSLSEQLPATANPEPLLAASATIPSGEAAKLIENAKLYRVVHRELIRQRKSEEALRESEERFRAILENSTTVIFIKSTEGQYLQINQWFTKLFGVTQAQIEGKTDFDIFPPAIAKTFRENDLKVIETGKALEVEEVAPHADGPHNYISVKFPLRRPDGSIYAIAGISTDITERKRNEEVSQRLAAIVDSSDDAIVGKNLEGIITSWNRGAERIFGYTANEAIGKSITLLIPLDRRDEEVRILDRIRRGERVEHIETVRQRKDGTPIEISLTISPIKDSTGTIIGASKIARDITERKRAERQQLALYELVSKVNRAAAMPDILEAAIEAICRCQNAARASILQYDADQVMRFKAWRGLSDEYRKAVEGHSPWRHDDPAPEPVCIDDVSQFPLEPALRAVISREGIRALAFIPLLGERELLGKFMVYYDSPHPFTPQEIRNAQTVASQVVFAIERHKSGEQLEHLVNQRTASLREAISQMEEFSYSVSHDLRAPLRAIHGFADAVLEDYGEKIQAEGKNYLERIVHNSSRMERLVNDVLTYSRVSRREVQLEPVCLEKLVRDIVRHYPEFDAAQIVIKENLSAVLAHEPSLSQAIANLLNNAVKFVPPGRAPRIVIRSEQMEDKVRLWVEDNGIGIKPEYQPRLFGMFERIHPEGAYEGNGIGLAIVRKAVERMGGQVGVESDGFHGSKFWIQLQAVN
ncbi:MAG TPA: PAS domain S-box protein [Candidatus Limnocylindrales bacterium]|nr:PAS domain S-box protein [Candidatus Limnocylindrales bacterium]